MMLQPAQVFQEMSENLLPQQSLSSFTSMDNFIETKEDMEDSLNLLTHLMR